MIKGTSIKYLDFQLRGGIRSKEFYMEGKMQSDATPFDTDFSEITKDNLESELAREKGIKEIIYSTYTGTSFGSTYYVIKKDDYDESKTYNKGDGGDKTRYHRTGIGANAISKIITSEWSDEYGYTMAQNGMYIPVFDLESEKILFTYEQYKDLREKMKGLSFYEADSFEIDKNVNNKTILQAAEDMREATKGKLSSQEKREKIVELVKMNLPKTVVQEMIGDLSNQVVEFIDTGSTGRGTNIPGDGDFDFMLKCANKDEQMEMITIMKEFIKGTDKGGTNSLNIKYKDVKIEGLEEKVDIDVTSEQKKLEVEYSSDLCVRDRLASIRKKYGEEGLQQVVDNIIVAKKKLKEIGAYKKLGSNEATELGGFGGIGVENWILQNGGSFVLAMETFLDSTKDEEGRELSFEEFKKIYPIYDFGQNHRVDTVNEGHDHFIQGLSSDGFAKLKDQFIEILCEYGVEYSYNPEGHPVETIEETEKEQKSLFFSKIITEIESPNTYKVTDYSKAFSLLAKYRGIDTKEIEQRMRCRFW